MWFFKKKTVEDYIKQIISIAKRVKKDFKEVYETGKTKHIVKLLKLIRKFDISQFYLIKKQTRSRKLMNECKEIYRLTEEALKDIEEKYALEKAEQVIDKIISLENYLAQDLESEIKFIPSKELNKILRYSPKEAVSKGYLFRGLSDSDFAKIMREQGIFAKNPNANVSLTQHILQQTGKENTQFISLTSDANRAKKFGRVIAVRMKRLRGQLLWPKDIEGLTKGETRVKRLRKKNVEFVLAPTRRSFACLPADAVVR